MQQQPKILCRTCRTLNEPGTRHCSNPECNSLLRITGVLYSEDPTLIRKEEAPQVPPNLEDPTLIRKKGAPQVAPVAPPVATSNRQISQQTTPSPVQSQSAGPPIGPKPKSRTVMIGVIAIIVLIVACIPTGLLLSYTKTWPFTGPKPTPTSLMTLPSLPAGIGSKLFPNGQYAGVNDGSSYPFDTQRSDPQKLRLQAMAALNSKGSDLRATSLWEHYLSSEENENDAEILIYIQNQEAIASHNYVTFMVGIDFPKVSTADSSDATRSALQGAYVAQSEFNAGPQDRKLRLLLVNTADEDEYVAPVAKQMASIIRNDKTVIGILGWQTSERTETMLEDLYNDGITIPMVSQTASSDYFTTVKKWNNLFLIAPPNKDQAHAAVMQAGKLQATEAIVFLDTSEPYSQNLGQDFEGDFSGTHFEVPFSIENTTKDQFIQMLNSAIKKVQNPKDTVVFFTGTTNLDAERFQNALAGYPDLQIITGDAGYVAAKPAYGHWYIIAYAYPDEWQSLMNKNPPFFQDYSKAFDTFIPHKSGTYRYNREDPVVIISYDAAKVLLKGIEGAEKPTSQDLQEGLVAITGAQAFQGVSGLIDFNNSHVVTNKSLVTLLLYPDGYIKMLCIQGKFASTGNNGFPQC